MSAVSTMIPDNDPRALITPGEWQYDLKCAGCGLAYTEDVAFTQKQYDAWRDRYEAAIARGGTYEDEPVCLHDFYCPHCGWCNEYTLDREGCPIEPTTIHGIVPDPEDED